MLLMMIHFHHRDASCYDLFDASKATTSMLDQGYMVIILLQIIVLLHDSVRIIIYDIIDIMGIIILRRIYCSYDTCVF